MKILKYKCLLAVTCAIIRKTVENLKGLISFLKSDTYTFTRVISLQITYASWMIAQGYLQIFGVVVNIAVIFQKFTLNINDVNQHIYIYLSINKKKNRKQFK